MRVVAGAAFIAGVWGWASYIECDGKGKGGIDLISGSDAGKMGEITKGDVASWSEGLGAEPVTTDDGAWKGQSAVWVTEGCGTIKGDGWTGKEKCEDRVMYVQESDPSDLTFTPAEVTEDKKCQVILFTSSGAGTGIVRQTSDFELKASTDKSTEAAGADADTEAAAKETTEAAAKETTEAAAKETTEATTVAATVATAAADAPCEWESISKLAGGSVGMLEKGKLMLKLGGDCLKCVTASGTDLAKMKACAGKAAAATATAADKDAGKDAATTGSDDCGPDDLKVIVSWGMTEDATAAATKDIFSGKVGAKCAACLTGLAMKNPDAMNADQGLDALKDCVSPKTIKAFSSHDANSTDSCSMEDLTVMMSWGMSDDPDAAALKDMQNGNIGSECGMCITKLSMKNPDAMSPDAGLESLKDCVSNQTMAAVNSKMGNITGNFNATRGVGEDLSGSCSESDLTEMQSWQDAENVEKAAMEGMMSGNVSSDCMKCAATETMQNAGSGDAMKELEAATKMMKKCASSDALAKITADCQDCVTKYVDAGGCEDPTNNTLVPEGCMKCGFAAAEQCGMFEDGTAFGDEKSSATIATAFTAFTLVFALSY